MFRHFVVRKLVLFFENNCSRKSLSPSTREQSDQRNDSVLEGKFVEPFVEIPFVLNFGDYSQQSYERNQVGKPVQITAISIYTTDSSILVKYKSSNLDTMSRYNVLPNVLIVHHAGMRCPSSSILIVRPAL